MNWTQVEGKWNDVKGHFKDRWGRLTDDDLMRAEGNKDRLVGLIQQKYGVAKEKAASEIEEFMAQSGGWIAQAKENVTEAVQKGKEYLTETNPVDMAKDLKDLIAKHPVASAIIGLSLGYLIGKLITSARS